VSSDLTVSHAPVVLVRGDDASVVADAARAALAALVGSRDPASTVEEHGVGTNDLDVGALCDALATPPFLVDRRVVVVRDAGRLVAGDVARLLSWTEAPVPGVHLVLVAGGGTVPASLVKAAQDHGTVIDVTVGTGAKRQQWLAEQVRHLPVRLDPGALRLLAEHLGDEVGRLARVVAPLVDAFGPGSTVSADDLAAYLGERGTVAPWQLTDAVDAGDSAGSLAVLHRLLGPGGFNALAVLTLLHRHFQTMLALDGAPVRSAEEAASLLGARSVYPVKKAMTQGRRLGSDKVAQAICLVADADLDLRGVSALDAAAVMDVLVGRLSRLAPSRRAAAGRRR
jgi:DNA polymerase-3 subunit delta